MTAGHPRTAPHLVITGRFPQFPPIMTAYPKNNPTHCDWVSPNKWAWHSNILKYRWHRVSLTALLSWWWKGNLLVGKSLQNCLIQLLEYKMVCALCRFDIYLLQAAALTGAPNWVTDSGLEYNTCNNRNGLVPMPTMRRVSPLAVVLTIKWQKQTNKWENRLQKDNNKEMNNQAQSKRKGNKKI